MFSQSASVNTHGAGCAVLQGRRLIKKEILHTDTFSI